MNITVYAASSGQVPDVYLQAARDLGTCLAARGHTLVNGAGRTGLMGATIDGIQAAGGRAVGVIPQFMIDEHWEHPDMAEMIRCLHCLPRWGGYARRVARSHHVEAARIISSPHCGAEHRRLFRSAPRPTGALRRTTVHASHTHGHLAGGIHARRGRALVRRNAALGCQCAPFCRALNGGALLCPPLF